MGELNENVVLTLEKMNAKIELIDPKTLEYLNKIEKIISNKFSSLDEIMDNLKTNRPSINNIAIESTIARQTFYNHKILKNYIDIRLEKYNQNDPIKRNEKLSEQISDLESIIKNMMERDVSIELMRNKVALVENEFKLLKKENLELRERYNNLKQGTISNEKNQSNIVKLEKKN